MTERPFKNKLNDLDPKKWLKFQKSWFVHDPPRRKKEVLRHPAKFPETLAQEFIEFFTRRGQVVLDPMVGTGSTLVAALRSGRNAYGIELNPQYAQIAAQVVQEEQLTLGEASQELVSRVIIGNAEEFEKIAETEHIPPVDYVITSPPYWDMLRARGAQTQNRRRNSEALDVFYSDDPDDLGNISDYEMFLSRLTGVYAGLKPHLAPGAYLTIIVKNVKKGEEYIPWHGILLSG